MKNYMSPDNETPTIPVDEAGGGKPPVKPTGK